jgi:hypothetical protein
VVGLFDKILDGSKTLTIRARYTPEFVEGDPVILKERLGKWSDKSFGRQAITNIKEIKPIQVKDITDEIAIQEGFKNAGESKAWLSKTYNFKSDLRWVFIIRWINVKRLPQLTLDHFTEPVLEKT